MFCWKWEQKSLDEEEVAIVMEIAKVREKGMKDKLPALRNVPKKKLLEETAKIDKVLSKFKTHSIKKTNELFYASITRNFIILEMEVSYHFQSNCLDISIKIFVFHHSIFSRQER